MASHTPFSRLFLILKLMLTFVVVVFGATISDPTTEEPLKMQSEVIGISELSNITSKYNLQDQLSTFQGEFKKLNDMADLLNEANSSCELARQMLMFHEESKKLQALMEQRTQQEDNKVIADEVANAVRRNYFKLAYDRLLQLIDQKLIPNIVPQINAILEAN